MTSSVVSAPDISQGDKLVISCQSIDKLLKTTITLEAYLFEISTGQGQNTTPKDIFYGVLDHSSKPVYVKIFHNAGFDMDIGNIFLTSMNATVAVNNVRRNEYMEISIAGDEFTSTKKRSDKDKMHIITQLLLEIDHIHSNKIIHNDIKLSNIVILEKEYLGLTEQKP